MLEILSGIFMLVSVVASIWLIVVAFKKSTAWGFGVWFIPFVSLYFIYKFWDDAKKPFLVSMSSVLLAIGFLAASFFSNDNTVKPIETAVERPMESSENLPKRTLTEEEAQALLMMEKTIEMMAKLPASDKQQQFLKVLRKANQFKRTVFSEGERATFRQEIKEMLNRTDLNKEQRQNFEKMLLDVEKQELPVVANPTIPSQEPEIATADSGQKNAVVQATGNSKNSNQVIVEKESDAETASLKDPISLKNPVHLNTRESFGKAKRIAAPFKRISFSQAKSYIGSEISFRGPRGNEQECTLVGVADKQIQCRKQLNSGSFSVSYKKGEVKSLKVLRQ